MSGKKRTRLAQRALEKRYPNSGLYRNDGSTVLIWPIHYLPTPKEVYVSSDGVHLVVAFLNWDSDSISERGRAVEFFANGQLLAAYDESELLTGYLGREVLALFTGVARVTVVDAALDDPSGNYLLETNWGDSFRFDVTTGEIIESRTAGSVQIFLLCLMGTAAVSVVWLLRKVLMPNLKADQE
ncbi:hypothetical protein Mal64_13020 [Pseudobythopirellula maris]|uniref:Uncharacterized protein n=2 Tax=Pseudobythopirellula maris TaxID=2527991 RepID=A0A5C5ZX57_9BACT|nr:hypothetical protein Mal64_13020 [Pseudobythopirellula maris]